MRTVQGAGQGLYEAWNAPWLGDAGDEQQLAQRLQQTRELAAAILAAPEGERFGDLVRTTGWAGPDADQAVLTGDGHEVIRTHWCRNGHPQVWIRYEAWDTAGRRAHGFLCQTCRKILQTG
jgi:hypothetical protein